MKSTIKIALTFIICCIVFSSCTIEKRHYQSGYYIDWKKKQDKSYPIQQKLKASKVSEQDNLTAYKSQPQEDRHNDRQELQQSSIQASTNTEIALIPKEQIATNKINVTSKEASEVKSKKVTLRAAKKAYKLSKKQQSTNTTSSNHQSDPLLELLLYVFLGVANVYGLNYNPTPMGAVLFVVFLILIIWTAALFLMVL